jgi:hypothetical protein
MSMNNMKIKININVMVTSLSGNKPSGDQIF